VTPRVRLVVAAAGFLSGLAAAAALIWGGYPTPTETLVPAVILTLAIGWSFLYVGLAASVARPDSRIGLLMVVAGFAALARAVAAINTHPAFVLGLALEDVVYGMAAHLLVAFPTGRLRGWRERALIGFVYTLTVPFDLAAYYFLSDIAACSACRHNIAVPRYHLGPLGTADLIIHPIVIVVCGIVLWSLLRRWKRASPALRRSLAPALLGGALFLVTIAVQRVGILLTPPVSVRVVLGWASHVALVFFPLGLLTGLIRSRLDRSGIADLAVALTGTPGPDGLRDALARAVHDPSLLVGYWLPERQQFVDGHGEPLPLEDRAGRAITFLEREGQPVAALLHDATVAEQRNLLEAVAATAGLAIENEQLHAAVRAQLAEVRASRARIVAAGVTERRRVERNLHDGAQQRLLSVLLGLRIVRTQLDQQAYATARVTVDEACRELGGAIEEIRELARGIHPAVLTDAGLPAALRSLAERSPLPVEIAAVPQERLPALVEETAYYVIAESLVNIVKHAGASRVSVEVRRVDGRLLVAVADDGVGGADPAAGSGLRGLADRVAALDGCLRIASRHSDGTRIIAELPCA
jgi:signal transduction histidine kinase